MLQQEEAEFLASSVGYFQFLLGCFTNIEIYWIRQGWNLSIPSRMLPRFYYYFSFLYIINFQFLLGCFNAPSGYYPFQNGFIFQFLLGCFRKKFWECYQSPRYIFQFLLGCFTSLDFPFTTKNINPFNSF